jgi:hypothetical protein
MRCSSGTARPLGPQTHTPFLSSSHFFAGLGRRPSPPHFLSLSRQFAMFPLGPILTPWCKCLDTSLIGPINFVLPSTHPGACKLTWTRHSTAKLQSDPGVQNPSGATARTLHPDRKQLPNALQHDVVAPDFPGKLLLLPTLVHADVLRDNPQTYKYSLTTSKFRSRREI